MSLIITVGLAIVILAIAAGLHAAVLQAVPGQHVFIATAAVADFRPRERQASKIKKQAGSVVSTVTATGLDSALRTARRWALSRPRKSAAGSRPRSR